MAPADAGVLLCQDIMVLLVLHAVCSMAVSRYLASQCTASCWFMFWGSERLQLHALPQHAPAFGYPCLQTLASMQHDHIKPSIWQVFVVRS